MASQAIFSADGTKFFAVTKAIRAELKSLRQEATRINVGAADAGQQKAAAAATKQNTAALREQTAASKAKTAATNNETAATKNATAEEQRKTAALRAVTAATNAATASTRQATAEENRRAASSRADTAQENKKAASHRAATAEKNKEAAASRALTAANNTAITVIRAETAAENAKTAAFRTGAAESNKEAAASRALTAANNAAIGVIRAETAAENNKVAVSRVATAEENRKAAASRANVAATNEAIATTREATAEQNRQAAASRATTAATNTQTAATRGQIASNNQQASASRAQSAASNASAASSRANTAQINTGTAANRQNASQSQAAAAASRAQSAATQSVTTSTRGATAEIQRQIAANRLAAQQASAAAKAQKQANAAIKEASGEAGFAAKAFQRFGATMLAFATGYLVIQGLGQAMMGLKQVMFDFPAMLEQTRVGFVGLFGNNDEAIVKTEKMMSALAKFAIPTPFAMADLAPMAQQAIAFDLVNRKAKDAAKETVGLLRDVGDAAFGLGRGQEGVDRLMLAFGQMKVATRVMGQEMLQMQQLGLNAWKYIAEGLNVTTAAARKMVTDGMVPADQAIRAIRAGIARDFGGSMERASKTVLGALAQIKDTLLTVISSEFKDDFAEFSSGIVGIAEYLSSNAFNEQLRAKIVAIREAMRVAKDVAIGFYDTVRQLNPQLIASLLLLNAVIKGSLLGQLSALGFMLNTYIHWDEATTQAKALTIAVTALGAAMLVLKANAAISSLNVGIKAAGAAAAGTGAAAGAAGVSSVEGAAMVGVAANAQKVTTAMTAATTAVTLFFRQSARFGLATTLPVLFGEIAASVSVLALAALPVLAGALGVGAVMMEKYQEKAAIVRAANADLARSATQTTESFDGLSKMVKLNAAAGDSYAKLKDQFSALKNTPQGMSEFLNSALPKARREIMFDAKLRPFEKRLVEEELAKLEDVARNHEIKLKAKLDADELNKGWFSLKNFSEAFYQTWGHVTDWFKMVWGAIVGAVVAAYNQIAYVTTTIIASLKQGWIDLVKGVKSAFGDLWYSISGGYESGVNRFLRRVADDITGFNGRLIKALGNAWQTFTNWASGKSGNYGETDGPELPSSMTDAERARQKAANQRFRDAQKAKVVNANGVEVAGPPVASPAQAAEAKRVAQRNKDLAEYNRLLKEQNKIPTITPTAPTGDPKKTKAQREAEKAAREAAAAAKRMQLDQLADTAKFYDQVAKDAETSAKRQMAAFQSVRDKFRDLFGGAQDELLKVGIIDNPLGGIIAGFEKWVGLEPRMRKLAQTTMDAVKAARESQGAAQSRIDTLQGGDGSNPGLPSGGVGSTATAGKIAAEADRMQRVAGRFVRQCDKLADTTVRNVTSVFNKIMGPFGRNDSAAKTMARFQAKGIGFAPTKGQNYNPGDIVYTGSSVGRGAGHVQIVGSDGRFRDQYGAHAKPTTRPQWVVRPDGSSSAVRDAASFMPTKGAGSVGMAFSGQNGASAELEAMFGNIDGALSKIRAVPKAWKNAVQDTAQSTIRFQAQTLLASSEFQDYLTVLAEQTHRKGQSVGQRMDEIVLKIRRVTNAADAMKNSLVANRGSETLMNELDRANKTRGQEDDPISALMTRMQSGDLQGIDVEHSMALWWKARRNMINDATQETHKFVFQETTRQKVMAQAAPLNQADTLSLMAYSRALEIASKKEEIKQTTQIKALLANKEWAKASALVNEQLAAFIKTMGQTSAAEATGEINKQIAAIKDQNTVLEWQQDWLKEGKHNQAEVARMTAAATTYLDTYNKVLDANVTTLGSVAAAALATSEAEKVFNAILSGDAVKTATDNMSDYAKVTEETTRILALAAAQQRIYFSGAAGPQMERALAMAKEESRLRQESQDGKNYGEDEITKRLGDFGQRFDSDVQTGAAQEYAKVAQDAAKAAAVWGDQSGLAALKFEMETGSLQSLTRSQKEQMLTNQAAILGMEEWGKAYEGLTSQQLGLAKQVDEMSLTLQGSEVTASQRQQLEWKYQDLEVMSRIASMTDAQREAYLRQKDAVDALREAMLPMMDAQEEAEKFLGNTRELMSRLDSIWGEGLQQIEQGHVEGFFTAIAEGVSSLLNDVSRQVLSALFTKVLLSAFPQLAEVFDGTQQKVGELGSQTLAAAGAAGVATAAYTAAAAAALAFAAASSLTGGFAGDSGMVVAPPTGGSGGGAISAVIGMPRVPRDMMQIMAHKDEAILTRDQADEWRGMRQGVFGSASSGQNAVSAMSVSNSYNIGSINMPEGTDGANFPDRLQERLSDRTMQQKTVDRIARGQEGR